MQRVTQSMMHTQMLRNLNSNMRQFENLQNQLSTGRKINKPSDDPVGITFSLRFRSEMQANDQYTANADAANSWLSYTDTMLDQSGQVIHRFRELSLQAANDTNDETALRTIKAEMEELYEQLVTVGNSQFNGKYVFNGQITDLPPYTSADAKNKAADEGEILFDIGAGVRISVNVSGARVFGRPDEDTNIFGVMRDMIDAVDPDNTAVPKDAIHGVLDRMDTRFEKFLEVRSEIGAKTNRISLSEDRLSDIGLNLTEMKSKTEDADLAQVLTKLKISENVYQASLAAGSRIIRPSLVDFLN